MHALVKGTVVGVEQRPWPNNQGHSTEVTIELPSFGQKAPEQLTFEVSKDFVQQAMRLGRGAKIVADVKVTSKAWSNERNGKSGRITTVYAYRFDPIGTAEAYTQARGGHDAYAAEPF